MGAHGALHAQRTEGLRRIKGMFSAKTYTGLDLSLGYFRIANATIIKDFTASCMELDSLVSFIFNLSLQKNGFMIAK